MAYINLTSYRNKEGIGIHASQGFWQGFCISKSRVEFICRACGEKRGPGTRYMCEPSWRPYGGKLCMFCWEDWFAGTKNFITSIETYLQLNKSLLEKNKDKWMKEAMAGTLTVKRK